MTGHVDANQAAEARVREALLRISKRPVHATGVVATPPLASDLGPIRRRAEQEALVAGRGQLLDDARAEVERIEMQATRTRVSGHTLGALWFGRSPIERARDVAALDDYVTAIIVEDLLDPELVERLRLEGDRMLAFVGSGPSPAKEIELPAAEHIRSHRLQGFTDRWFTRIVQLGVIVLSAGLVMGLIAGYTGDIELALLAGAIIVVVMVGAIAVTERWLEGRR